MQRTRKEVPAWIAIVGILVTLAVIQFGYYQGLVREPDREVVSSSAGGGGGAEDGGAPPGEPEAIVATIAGQPEPGHRDGSPADALFNGPAALAVATDGTVYVADSRNHCIRKIPPAGPVTTFAGRPDDSLFGGFADGPAEEASFSSPAGLALAPDGSLFVADTGNHCLRRISPDGLVSTYAGSDTPRDDLGRPTGGYRDGPAAQAQFRYPMGLAVDDAAVLYVADAGNHCLRRISPAGEVSTLPLRPGDRMEAPTQIALAPAGQLLAADTQKGVLWGGPKQGPLRSWRPAEEKGPRQGISGLAVIRWVTYLLDSSANVLLRLRDGESYLPIAGDRESGAGGQADGPGYLARFSCPAGMAVGPGGDLYIADFANNAIRRVRLRTPAEEGR